MNKLLNKKELMLLPVWTIILAVFGYPIIYAITTSFTNYSLNTDLKPAGFTLRNYILLLSDVRFARSFANTIYFTICSLVLEIFLGTLLALSMKHIVFGKNYLKTITLIPWILPTALIALAWAWILNDQYGVLNDILIKLKIISSPLNWLGNEKLAFVSVVITDVWKTTPFVAMLLFTGLQSIPEELYDAHSLDGAYPFDSFFNITLPLLYPHILIAALFRFTQAFGIFDLIKVLTEGGPGGSTEMLTLYIYSTVMRYLDFGYGSAMVVTTLIFIATLPLAIYISVKKFKIRL